MDNENKPRRPVSRGGVEYTPSNTRPSADGETKRVPPVGGETKRVPTVKPSGAPATRPPARRRPAAAPAPSGRKPQKRKASTAFAAFYAVTVVVGVVVCVIAFAIAFRTIRDGTAQKTPAPSASGPSISTPKPGTPTEGIVTSDDTLVSLAVVTAVNTDSKSLALFDVTSGKNESYTVESAVALKDKFGQNIVFAEFKAGDIVDLTLAKATKELLGIRQSAQVWTRENVSKVRADTEAGEIIVGNERFAYDANLFARYKNAAFDIAGLDPAQVVTLRGYQDQLLYLEVVRSFGYIAVAENKDILNGAVEIGVDVYPLADVSKPIKVPEGTHRVVVTGSNIDRYETETVVTAGEEATVSLRDVQLKAGVLTVTVNEPGATVTLNGVVKNTEEPFVLDYGDYTLRAELTGFEAYETTLAFREAAMEVSITLNRILQVKTFQIYSSPSGADVYVDNQYIGITPCSVTAEFGTHNILVRMADYDDVNATIHVSDTMYNPEYVLTPQAGPLVDSYEP